MKVPARRVQEEVLSKGEIQAVLEDLKTFESWFYPVFALWLSRSGSFTTSSRDEIAPQKLFIPMDLRDG